MKASELSQTRKNRAEAEKNQSIDDKTLEGVRGGAEPVPEPPIAGTIGGTIGGSLDNDPQSGLKKTL